VIEREAREIALPDPFGAGMFGGKAEAAVAVGESN